MVRLESGARQLEGTGPVPESGGGCLDTALPAPREHVGIACWSRATAQKALQRGL